MSNQYTTLYLCGPMTGQPEFNRPAFKLAAKALEAAGYTVLSPADNTRPEHQPWANFMRDSIGQLVQADGLAMLFGWQYSRGAKIEVQLARDLGIPCRSNEQWLLDSSVAKVKSLG
jgi:nucleoside 2-deoxyribosyltransferase